jgi:cell division protein ZapA
MADKSFTIHVQVGGFKFPLTIDRADEELYRNAEKMLDRVTERFVQTYRERPREEILTLVAFQFAVAISKYEINTDTTPLAERIQALDEELEAFLSEN